MPEGQCIQNTFAGRPGVKAIKYSGENNEPVDFAIPQSTYKWKPAWVAGCSGDADRDITVAKALNPFRAWGNLMLEGLGAQNGFGVRACARELGSSGGTLTHSCVGLQKHPLFLACS
jgi:hypothetical protein